MIKYLFIFTIAIIALLIYKSTDPSKINQFKQNVENRNKWERIGLFYDWSPSLEIDYRSDLALAPPKIAPSPKITPPPKITPCPCTPGLTPKPGTTPCICPTPPSKISDCQAFIKETGGAEGLIACKNVLHAKCRDNNLKYKPANAAEQKCVDLIAKYSGNICNCMTPFHQIGQ